MVKKTYKINAESGENVHKYSSYRYLQNVNPVKTPTWMGEELNMSYL